MTFTVARDEVTDPQDQMCWEFLFNQMPEEIKANKVLQNLFIR